MHAVTICLVILALTCCASLLARVVKIPLPFIQIAVGVAAGLPPLSLDAPLEPHTFLLLFIPPLLFADGWNLPRRELLALRWPVLGLSVGLVLVTVLAGGYVLHWLIPSMPLSVAFAVAAVVSPTDAVAVSAITVRVPLPHRMRHLLESEALLNDASGLVAMRFALAATLNGNFSIAGAPSGFVLVACGGLAVGWLLTHIYALLHRRLLIAEHDAVLQTVLIGLLPFAAFAIAEELELSGILAAVAAGMAASRLSLLETAHFSARIQTGVTWSIVSYCLNGSIFVLLGLQLPEIIGAGPDGIDLLTNGARFSILGLIAGLTAFLIILRCLWVLSSACMGRLLRLHDQVQGWRVIAASSLAGVRGVVTLAGVLSFPLALPNGLPFPSRDLAITLATGVILLSMLIAAITLPLLLRGLPADEHGTENETRKARIAATKAALESLMAGERPIGRAEEVMIAFYRERLAHFLDTQTDETIGDDEGLRELDRQALHAERQAIQQLRRSAEISDPLARKMLGELDVLEAASMHRPGRHGATRVDKDTGS